MSSDHGFDSFAVEGDARARLGQSIGARTLERLIHVGMIDSAYFVTNPETEPVVIRILHRTLALDESLREKYVSACYVANQIAHASVPQMLEEGALEDGTPFVVTPLLQGVPASRLMDRPMPAGKALRIARDALLTLAVAHRLEIVHGAITPSHLFVTDEGHVKVLGFGMALLRARVADRAPGYDLLGWVAPEQRDADSASGGPRADLWSLSAVMLGLLLGSSSPPGANGVIDLGSLVPDAPAGLVRLFERALAEDPAARFSDAETMRALVEEALELHGSYTPPRSGSGRRGFVASKASLSSRYRLSEAMTEPASLQEQRSSIAGPHLVHAATIPSLKLPDLSGLPSLGLEPGPPEAPLPAQPLPASSGRSTQDPGQLQVVFRFLDAAIAARSQYGTSHPEWERCFVHFRDAFAGLLATNVDGVWWDVKPYAFAVAGTTVWEPEGVLAVVPFELFADGIRHFQVSPGIGAAELETFVRILSHDVDDLYVEDDLATLLWEAHLPHVSYETVDFFIAEDREIAEIVQTERRRILGLARFDTSLQLEECWQNNQDAAPPSSRQTGALSEKVASNPLPPLDGELRDAARSLLARDQEVSPLQFAATLQYLLEEADRTGGFEVLCDSLEALLASMLPARVVRVVVLLAAVVEALGEDPGARERRDRFMEQVVSQFLLTRILQAAERSDVDILRDGLATILARGHLPDEAQEEMLAGVQQPRLRALLVARTSSLPPGSKGPDRTREELRALVEHSDESVRVSTLATVRARGLKAAGPLIVLRVRSPSFDKLSSREKRSLLETVVELMPSRGEAVCLEIIQSTSIVPSSTHDESRVIAAEVLGRAARSAEVADVLDGEAKKYLRNSMRVRQALSEAAAAVRSSSRPPGEGEYDS